MNIAEQFNIISQEYDSGRRKFIPCFDEYYDLTTEFVASSINKPSRILDLGAGTGLLTSYWYRHFPEADFILTDIAEEMLEVAKNRFAGLKNVSYEVSNYKSELPAGDFDVIISALSIHHLEKEEKSWLFRSLYEKLSLGGCFINYDQFCGDSDFITKSYDEYWLRFLKTSGLSAEEIEKWQKRRLFDRENSVSEEISMIKKAGFTVSECIYSRQKFSVIFSMK